MKAVSYYTEAAPLRDPARGSHVPTTPPGKRQGEGKGRKKGRR